MVRSMTKRGMPKPFAILLCALLALLLVPLNALGAAAAPTSDDDNVTFIQDAGENCNGIAPTPGSANTTKDLVAGDLQPGGTVTFRISYPTTPLDEDDRFVITDCFVRTDTGAELDKFEIRFVPNDEDFEFEYTLVIPADVPLGTEVCNYAKTTEGPSASPASNRKAGVCFTVGGTLRIEKRDAVTNALLLGAQFTVDCDATVAFPSVVISGLEDARPSGAPVTGNPTTGFANDGFIAISGPEGTECTVTELQAPPGYVLPDDTETTYVIPRSGSADATQVILNSAPTPTDIVTEATATVTVGASIQDTATVTPSDAVGTVTFRLYGPGDATCSGTPIFTSAGRALTAGVATSASFTPSATGTYRWIAEFISADEDVFLSSSGECNDADETSVVIKRVPTISTDAEDEAQLLSTDPDITDIATVSNLTSDATGTVTFSVYGPGDTTCTGTALFTNTKPIGTVTSGTASVTSDAFTPSAVGTYRWIASYSGDAKNEAVSGSCNDANESSVVLPTSPTITTDADDTAKLPNDTTIDDTATLSGVTGTAGGTITFKLYGPDPTPGTPTCTDGVGGNLVFTSSAVAVDGPGTYGPVSTTVTRAGVYFWIASYSGDDNNSVVSGVCGDVNETSTVDRASPQISTSATGAQLPGMTSISDTATVTGLTSDAGGTVTFNVWGPLPLDSAAACVGTPFATRVVTISGVGGDNSITVSSGSVPITQAGEYFWVASYGGDDNNHPITGSCGDEGENSTVNPADPTISTTATPGSLPTGSISDSATLTGVTGTADGTITFRLYGPSAAPDCSGSAIFTSAPITVNGPNTYGPVTTTVANAGSYYWIASYSGDVNNNAAAGSCGDAGETSVVTRASPDISTQAVATDDTLPSSAVQDTATLTGLSANATGTVTFRIYSDDECSTVVTTLGPVAIGTVTGGTATATSPSYTGLTSAGTYFFIASYSGDSNNNGVEGECGDENEDVTINKAQPTVVTEVPFRLITLGPDGSDLTDTATLSGGTTTPPISGEIEFVLYGPFAAAPGPNSCTADKVLNGGEGDHNPQSRTVNGNGSYTTTNPVHVTNLGFYTWIATYNGDANNNAATHACGLASETVQVLPRQPVVSTQISATSLVIAGQGSVSFSDRATISEASNTAGGTISFRLFGPGTTVAAACDTTGAVQGSSVAVNGNGTYQGPAVSVSAPGFYSWVATYSGDANNLSATHACGLASETVQVFSGQNPTLQKIADPPTGSTVQRGDTIKYTVTVGNTGDVTVDDGVVTDTLPAYVTVDQVSVTASGGTFTAGGDRTKSAGTIQWTVDLAPGQATSFVYNVRVDADAPELADLVNLVDFLGLQRTTTHRVPEGNLTIAKEVSPVAGGGVVVELGDTLTYTLTATASGQQNQTNVVVTDYVPGFDPARTSSGSTTYVPGSATCVGVGTCTVTGPGADGLITWSLGSMAAGTSRQVTFQVTIDEVQGEPGETVAVDILNAGAVQSTETGRSPSNEVVTPVTEVFAVKAGNPPVREEREEPSVLPRTGSGVPLGQLAAAAIGAIMLGLMLMVTTRRRGAHRI